jgi:glycosyltransferase involved in cell wall biosynthesis
MSTSTHAANGRPLVSVVMPVYNACRTNPEFLRGAARSVAEQTYRNLELIIVDDGSTDASRGLCEEQVKTFPAVAVRVVAQAHGGQSSARNAGIRESRGELVSFLDQDDLWYPDKLERVVPLLGAGADMVYTDADTITESGDVIMAGIHRNHRYGWPHPKRDVEDILFVNAIVMPGLMTVRRDLLLRVGGFDESLSGYEDDDLFLRLYQIASITYVPESTMKWRRHDEAYSLTARQVRSRVLYWQKLLAEHAGGGADARRVQRISTRFFRESLRQAGRQLRAGNPLWKANLAAAEQMAPYLRGVERLILGRHAAAWCRATARSKALRYLMERSWRVFPVRRR